ncbi:ankyrin repeat-containing protein [Hamiltosporidium magnivora]|uniref:Ankyrin repeat-containing protein n=1 Tax=Hamiltosporidium magnivora TaxID=148818 RepID=A0A4Q9L857_9MICR|nr:ankyrin repeat-containing protein [Hamiltosporidium magnivora]
MVSQQYNTTPSYAYFLKTDTRQSRQREILLILDILTHLHHKHKLSTPSSKETYSPSLITSFMHINDSSLSYKLHLIKLAILDKKNLDKSITLKRLCSEKNHHNRLTFLFILALTSNRIDVVSLLLKASFPNNINQRILTPSSHFLPTFYHLAISINNTDLLLYLNTHHKPSNTTKHTTHNLTPLHFSSLNNTFGIILPSTNTPYTVITSMQFFLINMYLSPFNIEKRLTHRRYDSYVFDNYENTGHLYNPDNFPTPATCINSNLNFTKTKILGENDHKSETNIYMAESSSISQNVYDWYSTYNSISISSMGLPNLSKHLANWFSNPYHKYSSFTSSIPSFSLYPLDILCIRSNYISLSLFLKTEGAICAVSKICFMVHCDINITFLLIKYGGNCNQRIFGMTPLHIACMCGNRELACVYIAMGVDVNNVDDIGNTAMHYAAVRGNIGCVEYLIEMGGSITIRNKNGITVCDIMKCKCEHVSIIGNEIDEENGSKELSNEEKNKKSNEIDEKKIIDNKELSNEEKNKKSNEIDEKKIIDNKEFIGEENDKIYINKKEKINNDNELKKEGNNRIYIDKEEDKNNIDECKGCYNKNDKEVYGIVDKILFRLKELRKGEKIASRIKQKECWVSELIKVEFESFIGNEECNNVFKKIVKGKLGKGLLYESTKRGCLLP